MNQNPWLEIPLEDYEGHMALPEIGQATLLAEILESAIERCHPRSLAVIGCAGGNGFERIPRSVGRVVGIDINACYAEAVRERYGARFFQLEMVVGDIQDLQIRFSPVELVYAGLLFEYVDPNLALKNLTRSIAPGGMLVVVLQRPMEQTEAITPSRYSSLQRLAPIHRLVELEAFKAAAAKAGFEVAFDRLHTLPSGKTFAEVGFLVQPIRS